jgi:acyl carrier protein
VPYHRLVGRAHARAMEGLKQPKAVQADDDGDDEFAVWLVVVKALRSVVPHIDIEEINRFEPLRDEADLDTSDWMRLMAAVTDQTGVVVPEQDYPLVDTFDGLEQYLAAQTLCRGR